MSFGYHRRILRVNLTDGQISIETPDDVFYRRYLGGAGLRGSLDLYRTEQVLDPQWQAVRQVDFNRATLLDHIDGVGDAGCGDNR